jgi:hypothetical protein
VVECELLAEDPELPAHLRRLARKALKGAVAASESLEKLRRVIRLEQDLTVQVDGLLDLERSTAG